MNQAIPPQGGSLSEAQRAELLDLMGQNRKIEAIKRYREITGAGLAEAKAAVETLAEGGEIAPPAVEALGSGGAEPPLPLSLGQEQELVGLLQRGQKIEAIKKYREFMPGTELMTARLRIEALAAKHGIKIPSKCFIATAVFGEGSVQVAVLRDWRDERLAPSCGGRMVIWLYELTGPWLAALTRHWPWLRDAFRTGLSRWVEHLVRPGRR